MKIGFDAKRITNNATGLGNYSRYIVNCCSEFYPENQYHLYSPGKGNDELRKRIISSTSVLFHYPENLLLSKFSFYWRSYGIVNDLQRDSIDLFHGLSNEIPFSLRKRSIPTVLTIHDLIFLKRPEYYRAWDRIIYSYKYRKSALLSDRIISVSEMTKKDLVEMWRIPEDKIDVVYQGCDISFTRMVSEEEKEAIKVKYNIQSPYILYVGSIEQRKNLLLLLQAIKDIKKDISVVAIGRPTDYLQLVSAYIKENNLTHRVKILHNIPFSELPAFYQSAEMFVYPSFYEGFGIPILEALCSGIPVIGATGSCLEEAGGKDSLYTDPNNPAELRSIIEEVLRNEILRKKMIKSGLWYAGKFTPQHIANDLMTIYHKILK